MPDKPNLDNLTLVEIENVPLTLKEAFQKVLNNFTETPTNGFNLLETVILSCVLVEAVVKNQLKNINPALLLKKFDPIEVALISHKEKRLITKPDKDITEVITANIRELLTRISLFEDISKFKNGIENLIDIRNKIIHSAENISLDENYISIQLTKFVFPFIKQYINVNPTLWQRVEKIANVAHDTFKTHLVRKIFEHRQIAAKFEPAKIQKLIDSKLITEKEEFVHIDNLLCPACQNKSMGLVVGADFDVSDGETTSHGYQFAECRVCDLKLEEIEMDEIIDNPESYFSPNEDNLLEWVRALEQPDYSEI